MNCTYPRAVRDLHEMRFCISRKSSCSELKALGIGHWAHFIVMFIIHNALLKHIETMAVPGRNVLEEKAIL